MFNLLPDNLMIFMEMLKSFHSFHLLSVKELNQQPLGARDIGQPTEPHRLGCLAILK